MGRYTRLGFMGKLKRAGDPATTENSDLDQQPLKLL